MSRPSACPTSDRLGHLLGGELPALDEAAVAEHLSECAICQRRLEEQAAGGHIDPELVRQLSRDDRPPRDSAYWSVLSKLKQGDSGLTTIDPGSSTGETSSLSFLEPPTREGALGKFAEFDVLRVVGRGGMGIVFEAIDPCLERRVAVKVLDPKFAKDEIARQRFCREARAAAAVTHENVVIIHSVNEHAVNELGDLPYLVMQFVEGESLQERIDHNPPSVAEAVAVGRQVAAGLAAAHARGLVHRDVKPANVLITFDEYLKAGDESNVLALSSMHRVKLTDFGLARATEDVKLTQTGFAPGTPQYMAPEQARGEQLDHRSDLFSLGGVLYALVTGRAPFQGSTPYLVLRQVTEEMPVPIKSLNPQTPDWLAAIIERLLAKNAADRFQSAAEVASLLFEGEARLLFCPIHGVKPPSGLARVTAENQRRQSSLWSLYFPLAFFLAGAGIGAGVALPLAQHWHQTRTAESTPPLATFDGRSGAVWSVAFSPDGSTLAMATEDGTVRLWNRADGSVIGSLVGHRGSVWSISFKSDGSGLVTAGDDGTVRLWALPSRQPAGDFKLPGSVRSVQFTQDGSAFVTSSRDGSVMLWDAMTLEEKASTKGHAGVATAAVISADGSIIASGGSDKVVKVWDAANGRERFTFSGHTGPIYGLALSPDGLTLASCGWDHSIRLWDLRTGEPLEVLNGHAEDVWAVAFSPDGQYLASAGQDKLVKVWNVATGKEVKSFNGQVGVAHTARFSPDGKAIAVGGRDGTIKVWPAP